jgi:hypothetical protein
MTSSFNLSNSLSKFKEIEKGFFNLLMNFASALELLLIIIFLFLFITHFTFWYVLIVCVLDCAINFRIFWAIIEPIVRDIRFPQCPALLPYFRLINFSFSSIYYNSNNTAPSIGTIAGRGLNALN